MRKSEACASSKRAKTTPTQTAPASLQTHFFEAGDKELARIVAAAECSLRQIARAQQENRVAASFRRRNK